MGGVAWEVVRILTLLEQFINPFMVLLKKSIKCIKIEPVSRVRAGEASGVASVNVRGWFSTLK